MLDRTDRVCIFGFVWIASACLFGLLSGQNIPGLLLLSRYGVACQGTVFALEPDDHGLVHYQYTVDGKTYASAGYAWEGTGGFASLSVGGPVPVRYLEYRPGESILGDPHLRLRSEVQGVVVVVLLFPTILVGIVALGLVIRRAPAGNDGDCPRQ